MDTSTGVLALVPFWGTNATRITPAVELAFHCPEIMKTYVLSPTSKVAGLKTGGRLSVITWEQIKKTEAQELNSEILKSFVNAVEALEGETYRYLLVLDPRRPQRTPLAVMECFQRLIIDGDRAGIVDKNRSLHLIRIEDLKADPSLADKLERHATYNDESIISGGM